VVQWLYEIKPNINISACNDYAFRFACSQGHLNVAQWLYEIKPYINISANNDETFRNTCLNGHLVIAQWLCQIKPDINISANNDEAFKYACILRHLYIAQWLCDLLPSKYHIETLNDHTVIWHIKQITKIIKIDQTINIYINELTKCPICNESDINVQTNCTHSYCLTCINKWHNKSSECPMCRHQITHVYNVLNKECI
jgi:hypothetical protein